MLDHVVGYGGVPSKSPEGEKKKQTENFSVEIFFGVMEGYVRPMLGHFGSMWGHLMGLLGFHGGLWGRENVRIIRILMFLWVSVGPIPGPMLGNLGSIRRFPLKGVLRVMGSWVRARGPRTPFTPRTPFKGNCVTSRKLFG